MRGTNSLEQYGPGVLYKDEQQTKKNSSWILRSEFYKDILTDRRRTEEINSWLKVIYNVKISHQKFQRSSVDAYR